MIDTAAEVRMIHEQAAVVCGEEFIGFSGNQLTVAPADAKQASKFLHLCDQRGIAVSIEGAGTKQDWLDAAPVGVRLLTHRMNTVLEHTWQDMTCTVEAGCTWQKLQDTLAQHGQFVALDPAWAARATVGGIVGANDSGVLRLRYGGLRDLLIGMTVVLADGTVAKSGGKVVKNVAGYDLPKLLCGSFGTLALIAEVTFRLHSIARHTLSLSVSAASSELLGTLLLRLLDSHFSMQSVQLRNAANGFVLDLRLSAMPSVLEAQSEDLMRLATPMGGTVQPAENDVWSTRELLLDSPGDVIVFKASMLPGAIAQSVKTVASLGGTAVAQATGLLTGSVPASAVEALMALRSQLERAGGSLVVLCMPDGVELDRWGTRPDSLSVMRAVKMQFDPDAILNPGRFLGDFQ